MKKNYKSEEEFLKDYNPKDFDQLSMTADILLISVSSEDVNNLWLSSFDKLIEYKLIEKDGKNYVVTSKGTEHYKTL